MIFCETANLTAQGYDTVAVIASQLRAHGLPAVVSQSSVPAKLGTGLEYDLAPFLTSRRPTPRDHVLLMAADKLSAARATGLGDLVRGQKVASTAYGLFDTRQTEITIASRLAFSLNTEPDLIPLGGNGPIGANDAPVFAAASAKSKQNRPKVAFVFPDIAQDDVQQAINRVAFGSDIDIEIITSGSLKNAWIKAHGYTVPVWHLGELLPRALAARYAGAVFFAPPATWTRAQMFFANLAASGSVLVDATRDRLWSSTIDEVIAGPTHILDIVPWLSGSVMPEATKIATAMQTGTLATRLSLPAELAALSPPKRKAGRRRAQQSKTALFVPTNGVGLGHAKRCSLVADALRPKIKSRFAAFPSCLGMLTTAGFDTVPLVSRSAAHRPHDNDIVNYARIDAALADSAALVFDGGYVFDSILRSAAERHVPNIWIRRGLWQAGQNNQVALDRQKAFEQVIVPLEAFDELNDAKRATRDVVEVGPIVQRTELGAATCTDLAAQVRRLVKSEGKRLIVTMLGGGVAADRRAQINAIASHLAGRSDVLHLVVVWPTATVDPAWFQYGNTHVVQTVHASVLIKLADLFISAVGYNSFHEVIYGQVPTIFVPQMASYMDDQRARACAAADREVAILVEPWALLSLTQAIDRCLDGYVDTLRDNLRGLNLPSPGVDAAAAAIAEVIRT